MLKLEFDKNCKISIIEIRFSPNYYCYIQLQGAKFDCAGVNFLDTVGTWDGVLFLMI